MCMTRRPRNGRQRFCRVLETHVISTLVFCQFTCSRHASSARAQMKITNGGVDLAFMDESYRGYTPDILK